MKKMKKIKSIVYIVRLRYSYKFLFKDVIQAAMFLNDCINHAADPDDVNGFEISTRVEYEEEPEEIPDITEPITEDEI